MADYLLFTLVAPLASFGDLAGHERRGSADWPGRSALLGLIGAALGVDRADADGQAALADGYGVAVRTLSAGRPLRDFHTFQSVPAARAKAPATRADALRAAGPQGVETSITIRDYRADVAFTAAVWTRPGARWPLGRIAEALAQPVFALWLGRKSCPLSAPLRPRLAAADDVLAAFAADPDPPPDGPRLFRVAPGGAPGSVAADPDGLADPWPPGARQEERWDQPGRRSGWQFAPRPVIIVPPPAASPEPAS